MNRRQCFDASLDFPVKRTGPSLKARIVIQKKEFEADFHAYKSPSKNSGTHYARICASLPFSLKWKDVFEVRSQSHEFLGKGLILHPFSEEPKKLGSGKRMALLDLLSGNEEAMLLALAEGKGFQGLQENDIVEFCRIDPGHLEAATKGLEEEGRARILGFSPLVLLSQASFDFLCQRILEFLSQFHAKHPDSRGVAAEKISKRFGIREIVLHLALKHLIKRGEIQALNGIIALSSFRVPLSPQEENILQELEQMCFNGKFSTVTLDDIRKRFQVSADRLQTLMSFLIDRKKIVQGKEGFYLHSCWLDEIVKRIRKTGKKELSVAEFKEMIGLSRKFAIPLLELLDEMGVTKRKGPGREIL